MFYESTISKKHQLLRQLCLLVLTGLLCGCGAKLVAKGGPDEAGYEAQGSVEDTEPSLINTIDNEDGTFTSIVDAMNYDNWVLFSFATQTEVLPSGEPSTSSEWDLGFKRYDIILNSGISGPGETMVAAVVEEDFESMTKAPLTNYLPDLEDSDDEDEDPDYGFSQAGTWYDYNSADHTLTPKDIVFIVRTGTGRYYKIKIEDYYNEVGDSGVFTLTWGELDAPE